jgi:hypothetical protein
MLIVVSATPSAPLASVYKTSTGMVTVACTLEHPGLSVNLSTLRFVIVPVDEVDLALMNVKGYVHSGAFLVVSFKV